MSALRLKALIREQGLSDCVTLTGKLSPEAWARDALGVDIRKHLEKAKDLC